MSDAVVVAIITTVGVLLVALIGKVRGENKAQHAEASRQRDVHQVELVEKLGHLDGKVDGLHVDVQAIGTRLDRHIERNEGDGK